MNFHLLKSIHIQNFRKFHQTVWILPILLILVNFDCFLVKKRPKKVEIQKKIFRSILFCWKASKYQISENFTKRFGFCQFSYFWSILTVFWLKNGQKRSKSKKRFLEHFVLLGSIYIPNFRKFHQRFGFCQYSSFLSISALFSQKRPTKAKIENRALW